MAPSGQTVEDQYLITLRGVAGPAVRAIFADLQVTTLHETTTLAGVLPERAALHGVLHRIEDLGLEVIGVRRQPWPKVFQDPKGSGRYRHGPRQVGGEAVSAVAPPDSRTSAGRIRNRKS